MKAEGIHSRHMRPVSQSATSHDEAECFCELELNSASEQNSARDGSRCSAAKSITVV